MIKMCFDRHVKCRLLWSHFSETFPGQIKKNIQIWNFCDSSNGIRVVLCGQKDGQTDEIQTDITKLIVGFGSFAKAPKNESKGLKIYIFKPFDSFLGAFAKLPKPTISFVMSVCISSVCPSFCPHRTTRIPLDESQKFHIWIFFLICPGKVSLKCDHNNRHFTWRSKHIFIISPSLLHRIRTVYDNSRCETKTHILRLITFFPKIMPFKR